MFLSSVSTLMFNANPLMRYDGYFMLSDYLEIPNLSQKARLALISKFRSWSLGLTPINHRQLPTQNRFWFAAYIIASFAYKWFIMIAVFWFVRSMLEPYGLAVFGKVLIAMSLTGMVVIPLFKAIQYMCYPGRYREVKKFRLARTIGLVSAVVLAISFLPLPHYVSGYARIRPQDAQIVSVTVPGTIDEIRVRPGDSVRNGDVIAVLMNLDLELEMLQLEGDLATANSDLVGFELNRNQLIDSERYIAELRVKIRNLRSVIDLNQQELERLTLRADRDGIVILAENVPQKANDSMELQHWSGTPLDPENLGALLEPNTIVCMVAQQGRYEASVVVDQADVQLVAADQAVSIMLEQSAGKRFTGKVVEISQDEITLIPRELSQTNGGPIAVKPSPDGGERPLLKSYEIYADLPPVDATANQNLGSGFHDKAKILPGNAVIQDLLKMKILFILAFAVLVFADRRETYGQAIVIRNLPLQLIDDVEVASLDTGVVTDLHVRPGDYVANGAVLLELDRDLHLAEAAVKNMACLVADAEAGNDVNLRFSQKTLMLNGKVLEKSLNAIAAYPKSISETEIDKLRLERDQSELSIEQAQLEQEVAILTSQLRREEKHLPTFNLPVAPCVHHWPES